MGKKELSIWKEIRNDHIQDPPYLQEDGIRKIVYIDAWKTEDNDEQGKTIVKIFLTINDEIIIDYIDSLARFDGWAQEKIKEAIDRLRNDITISKFGIFKDGRRWYVNFIEPNSLNFRAENLVAIAFKGKTAEEIARLHNEKLLRKGV